MNARSGTHLRIDIVALMNELDLVFRLQDELAPIIILIRFLRCLIWSFFNINRNGRHRLEKSGDAI